MHQVHQVELYHVKLSSIDPTSPSVEILLAKSEDRGGEEGENNPTRSVVQTSASDSTPSSSSSFLGDAPASFPDLRGWCYWTPSCRPVRLRPLRRLCYSRSFPSLHRRRSRRSHPPAACPTSPGLGERQGAAAMKIGMTTR